MWTNIVGRLKIDPERAKEQKNKREREIQRMFNHVKNVNKVKVKIKIKIRTQYTEYST